MTTVQIPTIEFSNDRIHNCSIVIDDTTFNVRFIKNKYEVTKGTTGASSDKETPIAKPDQGIQPNANVASESNNTVHQSGSSTETRIEGKVKVEKKVKKKKKPTDNEQIVETLENSLNN